jgi:hypothetical protein
MSDNNNIHTSLGDNNNIHTSLGDNNNIHTSLDDNKNIYIRVDDNKIINEKSIKWVKKMDECLSVCTKSTGCFVGDAHKICKINNLDSYNKLNKHF